MLDSIYVGITGLQGYSNGLRAIANNTANINTPGFKSSSLQFSDLFYSQGNGGSGNSSQMGYGLNTGATTLNFKQGELRQTGNDLDMAIDGDGMFTLKDASGKLHYSRAGQFEFNPKGELVNRADQSNVMGFDAHGALAKISINGLKTNPALATTTMTFTNNLDASSVQTVGNLTVIDAAGGKHDLAAQFTPPAAGGTAWTVAFLEGATQVGSGTLNIINGRPDPANAKIVWNYTPPGLGVQRLTFDFSNNVTAYASSGQTLLAMDTQDGYAPGTLSRMTFDASGTLVLSYTNGQTVKGSKLALGRFDSADDVVATGGNQFDVANNSVWHSGTAGSSSFGAIHAGMVEISNVDLSQEFSDLVITQRGYQAASQIISSANDMLQELFAMKGK
jgi:flagellar hook protein FlgE